MGSLSSTFTTARATTSRRGPVFGLCQFIAPWSPRGCCNIATRSRKARACSLVARKFNNKVGPAVSTKFTKWRRKLGLNRQGLCFHSLRHSVSTVLEAAGVAETDVDRLTGHKIKGLSFGVYSRPAMLRLAEVVEQIHYDGVNLGGKFTRRAAGFKGCLR